jgi:hypothetical protein
MLKNLPRNSSQLQHKADPNYLEYEHRELASQVYQTIDRSGLDKFTFSFIDSLWSNLNAVVRHLDRLSEDEYREFVATIEGLMDAQNELRLARFLFEVEEINAVYRLVLRNRAVLRGKQVLYKVLRFWPSLRGMQA